MLFDADDLKFGSRNGQAIRLSKDHKVDDPDEVKRIKEAGSFIINGRLAGLELINIFKQCLTLD